MRDKEGNINSESNCSEDQITPTLHSRIREGNIEAGSVISPGSTLSMA